MTGRDRLMTALRRGTPDRVPTWDWFDEAVTLGVADLLGLKHHDKATTLRKGDETAQSIDLYCRVVEALNVDGTSSVYNTGLTAENADFGRDKYGRGYILSEFGMPAIIEAAVADTAQLAGYDMISRLEKSDFEGLSKVVERLGDNCAHCFNLNGPFQEAWNITGGMDKLMLAFLDDPEYAFGVLRLVTDFNKVVMTEAAAVGADFFMVDGDLTGNDFPLMSPEHFRAFILPFKREMVDHAHSLGRPIVKHSDGNMWSLIDDILAVGFDGFHPVQPQCMDLVQTKSHLYGKCCVFGNVDCLDIMVLGDPEATRADARRSIDEGAPGGGYVFCSSNSLHPGCKPENVIAMFEVARDYGSYDRIADRPRTVAAPEQERSRSRRQTRRRTAKSEAA
ncbi:MAG: hypothetical protein KDJ16_00585 [Hyphomicrobiales bacterium]|nr:hypothetical protein [Hyphomicrobiales bacterium]